MGNSITEGRNTKSITMKNKMIVTMIALFSFFAANETFGQATQDSIMMKDCCMMKDGKMMQMINGKMMPMEENVMMKNGTKCMPNGECVTKEGKIIRMKEGECMDMDGNKDKCDMMHMKKYGSNEGKSDSPAMAAYQCPMHPEITSDAPGKCSKCGMELIKKK